MTHMNPKPHHTDFRPRVPKVEPKGCLIGALIFIVIMALAILFGD